MSLNLFTESEIIQGLQNDILKRQQYEDSLYNRFSYFIEEGKRKYSLTHEDAFSAYSDTIINVLESITNKTFQGRSSLKTYIYQIFSNKCVDQVRKNTTNKNEVHKASDLSKALYTVSDTAKTILERLIDKSDIDRIKQNLNSLVSNCRQMLLLSADGYSDRDIAQLMGFKTPAVAKTSRLRCLEKLRQLYKSQKDDTRI
jgi:RNA polymerase sigma factor (sigma-70 family)